MISFRAYRDKSSRRMSRGRLSYLLMMVLKVRGSFRREEFLRVCKERTQGWMDGWERGKLVWRRKKGWEWDGGWEP